MCSRVDFHSVLHVIQRSPSFLTYERAAEVIACALAPACSYKCFQYLFDYFLQGHVKILQQITALIGVFPLLKQPCFTQMTRMLSPSQKIPWI